MGLPFGSPEWAKALQEEINASSEYRNAAARWGVGFNGNLLLAFEADDRTPHARHLLLRLAGGACGAVEWIDGPGHEDAGFALRGPFSLWRDVLERRTQAATAIFTGRMRVEGDTMTLLRFTPAHRALVHCVASLDTAFE